MENMKTEIAANRDDTRKLDRDTDETLKSKHKAANKSRQTDKKNLNPPQKEG